MQLLLPKEVIILRKDVEIDLILFRIFDITLDGKTFSDYFFKIFLFLIILATNRAKDINKNIFLVTFFHKPAGVFFFVVMFKPQLRLI